MDFGRMPSHSLDTPANWLVILGDAKAICGKCLSDHKQSVANA